MKAVAKHLYFYGMRHGIFVGFIVGLNLTFHTACKWVLFAYDLQMA